MLLLITVSFSCQLSWSTGSVPNRDFSSAKAAYYRGDYQTAMEMYQAALHHHEGSYRLRTDLALVLLEAKQAQAASNLLSKMSTKHPLLGEAYLAQGKKNEAIEAFEAQLQQPGSHSRSRLLLAWIAAKSNQHHHAIDLLWTVVRNNPKLAFAHFLMGRSFAALAKTSVTQRAYFIKRAKEEFKQARKIDASLWQVHRELAYLYESQENWKLAQKKWGRVKSVIGQTEEVKSAWKRLNVAMPTPTITATPGEVIRPAVIKPAQFKDITVKPLGQKDDPVIKVGLARSWSSFSFGCVGAWRAVDQRGRHFWKGVGKRGYRIKQMKKNRWYLTTWEGKRLKRITKPIMIKPLNPAKVLVVFNYRQNTGYFWSGNMRSTNYYRGQLKVEFGKKRLTVINHVLLEDYLLSVVPSEMPAFWPREALKTQAVVARTDTLLRRGTHRKHGYDVCTTAHCAVYRGVTVEHSRTHEAVAQTQGEVLTRKNKLIPTFYSHACGGLTQSFKEAWHKKNPSFYHSQGIVDSPANSILGESLPFSPAQLNQWLVSEPKVYCSNLKFVGRHSYRWIKIIERNELAQLALRKYDLKNLQAIHIRERAPSGYVRHVELIGSNKSKHIYRDYIRSAMGGLRSNLFQLMPIKLRPERSAPDAWVIAGGGWGHGVGLCQAGAGAMGQAGHDYDTILTHYFPDSEIKVWTK